MFFAFIGALIGGLIGGLPGLLVGGAVGYGAQLMLQRSVVGTLQVAQSQLFESVFSIMGALCKADSVVTRDEIDAVEQMFRMLRVEGDAREAAKAAFARGKAEDFDLDAAVDRFAALTRGRGPLVSLFLQMQIMAVAADGVVHPAEHEMLVRIARRLGLSEHDVAQLEALLRAATDRGGSAGAPPRADRLADAYKALGVTPESSGAEIKRAYRKLISETTRTSSPRAACPNRCAPSPKNAPARSTRPTT